MAIVITDAGKHGNGKGWDARGVLALDSSYPSNGYPLTAAQLKLRVVKNLDVESTGANDFAYDYTNSKLKVFVSSSGVEVGNGVDLSAVTGVHYRARGL